MERCKYLLPCGRCEKRGAPCDAPESEVQIKEEVKNTLHCDHNWQYLGINSGGEYYMCSKCGTHKIYPVNQEHYHITI